MFGSIFILFICAPALIFGQWLQERKSVRSCGLVTPQAINTNLCPASDTICNIQYLNGYDDVTTQFRFFAPVNSSTFSLSSMHASLINSVMEFSLLDEPIDQCSSLRNRRGRVGCPIIANEEYLYTFDPTKTTLPQMPPHNSMYGPIEAKLKIVFQGDNRDLEICTETFIKF